jgi:hypothetical protein
MYCAKEKVSSVDELVDQKTGWTSRTYHNDDLVVAKCCPHSRALAFIAVIGSRVFLSPAKHTEKPLLPSIRKPRRRHKAKMLKKQSKNGHIFVQFS